MKDYEVKYSYKYKGAKHIYSMIVRAENEEHAREIAYNKLDTRIFELV